MTRCLKSVIGNSLFTLCIMFILFIIISGFNEYVSYLLLWFFSISKLLA